MRALWACTNAESVCLQIGENDARFGPRFPAVNPVYSPALQSLARSTAEAMGISSRIREGTYVGVSGPSYETPHEIGAMRMLGGDAVGMSTVPEVSLHTLDRLLLVAAWGCVPFLLGSLFIS